MNKYDFHTAGLLSPLKEPKGSSIRPWCPAGTGDSASTVELWRKSEAGAPNGGRGGLGVTAPGPHPSSAATAPQQRLRHLIGWLGQVTAVSQSGVECEAVLISIAPEARAGL